MVSGIRFFACSGAMGNTVSSLYAAGKAEIGLEIFNFEIGATDSPNRLGFFGAADNASSPVVVGQYQDRTRRTDHIGTDLGVMINCKYQSASVVVHSGVEFTGGFANIPRESGTLLARFREPNDTAVITQNATFRAVNFNNSSGVPNINDLATGITIRAAQLQDTQGNAADSTWSIISSAGSPLSLNDQNSSNKIHDYYFMISGSPTAAGRKVNFGYWMQIEFL
jgi:hypothetical protein